MELSRSSDHKLDVCNWTQLMHILMLLESLDHMFNQILLYSMGHLSKDSGMWTVIVFSIR